VKVRIRSNIFCMKSPFEKLILGNIREKSIDVRH